MLMQVGSKRWPRESNAPKCKRLHLCACLVQECDGIVRDVKRRRESQQPEEGDEGMKMNNSNVLNRKRTERNAGKREPEKGRDIIRVEHLNKSFMNNREQMNVLNDITLSIREGEFVTIVGHSGCGKSTLLKIMCGLVPYEEGVVERNGHKVAGPGPRCGMVFQDHRLLPWLRVGENVGFGIRNLPRDERQEQIRKHLKLVGLEEFERAYPSQLSGGMAQRAAIARGLAGSPSILLLDEPFGALDALTRIQMQEEILRIHKKGGTTMVMVTHDIEEAVFLGDRVVVMSARPGEIRNIISIDHEFAGGRGSAEFASYKKEVYGYFFEDGRQENSRERYAI